jgi:hypothetical protein
VPYNGDPTEEVLRVAGLIGQGVPLDVLVSALELSPSATEQQLNILVDARVLERVEEEI